MQPDLVRSQGDPAVALAERLIIFINTLTPYAYLFEDDFKIQIKRYITVYEAARNNKEQGKDIFKLVQPTTELITKTLEKKLTKYN